MEMEEWQENGWIYSPRWLLEFVLLQTHRPPLNYGAVILFGDGTQEGGGGWESSLVFVTSPETLDGIPAP